MNEIDTINPCALSDNDIACVSPSINTAFNVLGIMFFVSFMAYLALHCI